MTQFYELEEMSKKTLCNRENYGIAKNLESQHKLDQLLFNSYFHKACASMAKNPSNYTKNEAFLATEVEKNNVKIAVANLDLRELFEPLYQEQFVTKKKALTPEFAIDDIYCGYYDEQMEYKDDYLMSFLQRNMETNETIFVYLDLHCYEVIYIGETTKLIHHSCCFIMMPNKSTGTYSLYYFNPYGYPIKDQMSYKYYLSRYRYVDVNLVVPLDTYFMTIFTESLNKQLELNFPKWKYTEYDDTDKHNYYGANLQLCDDKGICYLFPFIVWYNFYKFQYRSHIVGDRRFKSFKNLIESGDIETMVYIIFSKYDPQLLQCFEKYTNHSIIKTAIDKQEFRFQFEKIISESGEKFLDKIFIDSVYFICQPKIKNTIDF